MNALQKEQSICALRQLRPLQLSIIRENLQQWPLFKDVLGSASIVIIPGCSRGSMRSDLNTPIGER